MGIRLILRVYVLSWITFNAHTVTVVYLYVFVCIYYAYICFDICVFKWHSNEQFSKMMICLELNASLPYDNTHVKVMWRISKENMLIAIMFKKKTGLYFRSSLQICYQQGCQFSDFSLISDFSLWHIRNLWNFIFRGRFTRFYDEFRFSKKNIVVFQTFSLNLTYMPVHMTLSQHCCGDLVVKLSLMVRLTIYT